MLASSSSDFWLKIFPPFLTPKYALVDEGINAFANAVQNNNQEPGACHLKQKGRKNMKIKTSNQSAGVSACVGLALAAAVCTTSLPVQAALPDVTKDYTIQTIENPPGTDITEIFCVFINESGMVAMQCNSAGGTGSQGLTVVREKGVWKGINVPGSLWTGCGNPTDSGQVPLAYATPDGNFHNAIYHQGRYTHLPDCPLPLQCGVQLINDRLIMTGMAFDPTGTCLDASGGPCVHGVLLDSSLSWFSMFDYPGAADTYAMGLNNALQIVGQYGDLDGTWHAFFSDRAKTFLNVDPPGSANPGCWMINNQGEICGQYTDASAGVQQGFLLRRGKFFAFNVPKSTSTQVCCITDNGHLSGMYVDSTGSPHGFIATPRCDRH